MVFREDKGTGYMYTYAPNHPYSNASGKLLEHIFVMAESLGRPLLKGECVHHIDRDRKNNNLENLMLLTYKEHGRIHAEEDRGTVYTTIFCGICGEPIETTSKQVRKYCSPTCAATASKQFDPPLEELKALVWKHPTTHIAKLFGVSDVAVSKRCKKFGIEKPNRGYWRKIETGHLKETHETLYGSKQQLGETL